jgi:acetolactate synthase-1/2/3 large subunit
MGDGAFLMSVAEIETAIRLGVSIAIFVWVDGGYGLIGWKQDLQFGRRAAVSFGNPDFVALAKSFGARGYAISSADELLPTLRKAVLDDAVSVIACPVDYSENARLIQRLGGLTETLWHPARSIQGSWTAEQPSAETRSALRSRRASFKRVLLCYLWWEASPPPS